MSELPKMPELPEPELTCWYGPSSEFYEEPMYSADQLRADRLATWKAAMEYAAQICEDRAGTVSMFVTARDAANHNSTVRGCASAIRLAPMPGDEG